MPTVTETGLMIGGVELTFAQLVILAIGVAAYAVSRTVAAGGRAALRGGWALGRRAYRRLTAPPPLSPEAARLLDLIVEVDAWTHTPADGRASRTVPGSGLQMVIVGGPNRRTQITIAGIDELYSLPMGDRPRVEAAADGLIVAAETAARRRRLGITVPVPEKAAADPTPPTADWPAVRASGYTLWEVVLEAGVAVCRPVASGLASMAEAQRRCAGADDCRQYVIAGPGDSPSLVDDRLNLAAKKVHRDRLAHH